MTQEHVKLLISNNNKATAGFATMNDWSVMTEWLEYTQLKWKEWT
jgi:hypothetical protein